MINMKEFNGIMSIHRSNCEPNEQFKRNCKAVERAFYSCDTRKNHKIVMNAKRITKKSLRCKNCTEIDAVNLFFAFLSIICENEMADS